MCQEGRIHKKKWPEESPKHSVVIHFVVASHWPNNQVQALQWLCSKQDQGGIFLYELIDGEFVCRKMPATSTGTQLITSASFFYLLILSPTSVLQVMCGYDSRKFSKMSEWNGCNNKKQAAAVTWQSLIPPKILLQTGIGPEYTNAHPTSRWGESEIAALQPLPAPSLIHFNERFRKVTENTFKNWHEGQ